MIVLSDQLYLEDCSFPAHNNSNLSGIYPVEMRNSKEISDVTEFQEGWFVQDVPILPVDRGNVIYVPRPYFTTVMEILEGKMFWEIEIE